MANRENKIMARNTVPKIALFIKVLGTSFNICMAAERIRYTTQACIPSKAY